jgi:SAM-dependent methyltransferase
VSSGDYFSNHALKLRLPWRLYHGPIVAALAREIRQMPSARVLNVGSGPFLELPALPREGRTFAVCDIDPRAVEAARAVHGPLLARADVVTPGDPLPYADGTFDLVAAMDVIEHVVPPEPWLREAWRVLAPRGCLLLTTPNYGSWSLRALEATVLEAIARAQGFSRRDIHPSKFDEVRLAAALSALPGGAPLVRTLAHGWVLAATVIKTRA